jgi:hypothetical protein
MKNWVQKKYTIKRADFFRKSNITGITLSGNHALSLDAGLAAFYTHLHNFALRTQSMSHPLASCDANAQFSSHSNFVRVS